MLVHYDKHITGTLKNLSISDLTGVSTKEFFWLAVTLIHKDKIDDDVVYFNAGYLYRQVAKLRGSVDEFVKLKS